MRRIDCRLSGELARARRLVRNRAKTAVTAFPIDRAMGNMGRVRLGPPRCQERQRPVPVDASLIPMKL